MIKVIGVRFRKAGKVYYFDPRDLDIKQGSMLL
jgi:cell fate regulator YaaT (PSP1 superfamily)